MTLLGTDSKSRSNTYLIQLNLQPTPTSVLNDLIEVTSYSSETNGNSNGTEHGSHAPGNNRLNSKSPKEQQSTTNLLMIKAEKLNADSIVKCIRKLKCSFFCASSSRKVCALLSANKHRVKIYELEVEDDEDEENEEQMMDDDGNNNANEDDLGIFLYTVLSYNPVGFLELL